MHILLLVFKLAQTKSMFQSYDSLLYLVATLPHHFSLPCSDILFSPSGSIFKNNSVKYMCVVLFSRVYLTSGIWEIKICSVFHSVLLFLFWSTPTPTPPHPCSSLSLLPLEFSLSSNFSFYSTSLSILSALVKKSCWRKLVEVVRAAGQEARFWALGTSRATLGSISSALPTTSQPLSLILHLLLSTTAIGKALMVTDTLLP